MIEQADGMRTRTTPSSEVSRRCVRGEASRSVSSDSPDSRPSIEYLVLSAILIMVMGLEWNDMCFRVRDENE